MKKNNSLKNIGIVLGLVVVASLGYWVYDMQQPGKYDEFATCLGEKGATFYGAFWCPHCQQQKALFGKSKDKLPYVECSNADMKTQTQACLDKKIESYPTWEFTLNGTTTLSTGEKSLKDLAEVTGCVLPQ